MEGIHPGPGIWGLWGIDQSSLRLTVLSFFFFYMGQVYIAQSQGRTLTFIISFSGIFPTPATAAETAVHTF